VYRRLKGVSDKPEPPADSALKASSFGEEPPITPPEGGLPEADAPPALRIPEPTQEEIDGLSVMERLEFLERRRQRHEAEYDRQNLEADRYRQSRHQWFNSIGIAFGVVFTVASLIASAVALYTSREDLHTSRESQFTERYAKTIEVLGSEDPSVRLGALHALGRLMADSERDRDTITAVLASYSLQHDPAPGKKIPDDVEPAPDLQAALTVLGQRPQPAHDAPRADLHGLRAPLLRLYGGADLFRADLSGADLRGAHLNHIDLRYANLSGADLDGADLSGGTNLDNADLHGASLVGANLRDVGLHDANLRGADLRGADLSQVDLIDADLRDADLRGTNLDEDYVRSLADSVEGTKFGPLPRSEKGS
jgi:hypothetical protein